LLDQQHKPARPIPGQYRRGIADIVAFALLMLPGAIAALEIESGFAQRIVMAGKDIEVAQPDPAANMSSSWLIPRR